MNIFPLFYLMVKEDTFSGFLEKVSSFPKEQSTGRSNFIRRLTGRRGKGGPILMIKIDWENNYVEKNEPLYRVAYHALHYAIISGQVEPGEHLTENYIAKTLQISRTPLRMAIDELEKEGMVVRRHGRTIVQDSLDREMREILDTRSVLEGLAVVTACRKVTREDLKCLEAVNAEFAAAMRAGNIQGSARADERFHEEIYRIADNRVLLRTLHGLEGSIYGYRVRACKTAQDVEAQIRGHEDIIEALKQRREDLAEYAVKEHIRGRRPADSLKYLKMIQEKAV